MSLMKLPEREQSHAEAQKSTSRSKRHFPFKFPNKPQLWHLPEKAEIKLRISKIKHRKKARLFD
jgi:hypothetical protein